MGLWNWITRRKKREAETAGTSTRRMQTDNRRTRPRRSALLVREHHGSHTLGVLTTDRGHTCFILEPPWLDNAANVSCIPAGTYHCTIRKSPRFGPRYWLRDTSPRTFILAHPGNTTKHTLGCLLPGKRLGWINGRRAVLLSRRATRELEEHFGHELFELEIR